MPQYLYRIQPTRLAMLTDGGTPEEQATVGRHFAYLQQLMADGVLILAGRTLNADESTFGIAIFNAADDNAAQQILRDDPAIQGGVMRGEIFPYRVALIAEHNVTK
jgi:uncharacterized protein YciI